MGVTNRKNVLTLFGGLIVAAIILIAIWFIILYTISVRKATQEGFDAWFTQEFIPLEFAGGITYIAFYERCYCLVEISTRSKSISYNLNLCKKANVREFLSVGDSILKRSDRDEFTVIKQNRDSLTFRYPR